jgi:hypothetical protein
MTNTGRDEQDRHKRITSQSLRGFDPMRKICFEAGLSFPRGAELTFAAE